MFAVPMITKPGVPGFEYPTITVDVVKLRAALAACRAAKVRYRLGAKAPRLASPAATFETIDCSGFVRWALYQASGGVVVFPDGSVVQREACDRAGFKRCDPADVGARDGVLRIAFLSPADGGGTGHVMLVLDGATLESHGGAGPDSRAWGSKAFMGKCAVYVLMLPKAAPDRGAA